MLPDNINLLICYLKIFITTGVGNDHFKTPTRNQFKYVWATERVQRHIFRNLLIILFF